VHCPVFALIKIVLFNSSGFTNLPERQESKRWLNGKAQTLLRVQHSYSPRKQSLSWDCTRQLLRCFVATLIDINQSLHSWYLILSFKDVELGLLTRRSQFHFVHVSTFAALAIISDAICLISRYHIFSVVMHTLLP
jgi:hypothetical protein